MRGTTADREFKVGFSCIAYWAGKNLYNMVLLPFMAASFALAVYLLAPPLQVLIPPPPPSSLPLGAPTPSFVAAQPCC